LSDKKDEFGRKSWAAGKWDRFGKKAGVFLKSNRDRKSCPSGRKIGNDEDRKYQVKKKASVDKV